MLNFLGASENFSVMADSKWESVFTFTDEVDGTPAELDGVTFSGRVVVLDSDIVLALTRVDAYEAGNVLQLVVPPLPEGRWRYEIYALTETGYKSRLLYGYISAMGIADWDDAATYANRTLEIALPGDASKPLRTEWKACTAAMIAAKEAQAAMQDAQSLKDAADAALANARQAADKLAAVDDKLASADKALEDATTAKEQCEQMVANLPDKYVPTIGANGNWWLNGDDTGRPAIGTNGRDGADLLRVAVGSVDELPETGDGSTVYYVPRGDGASDCYVWAWTDASKTSGQWAKANETMALPTAVATTEETGTLKLGTATVVIQGAALGVNALGQGYIDIASISAFGAVKISTGDVLEGGQLIGYNSAGQLVCTALPNATLTTRGIVKLGSQCTTMESSPFLLSVATNSSGQLCNNLVRGGALQHRRKDGWETLSSHMPWMDTGTMTDRAYDYYLGLHTSNQFTQTAGNGLELLPATNNRVGGVTVNGIGHEVYTKPEVDTKVAAINSSIREVRVIAEKSVKANATLMSIQVLTESAYEALTTLSSNTLYIVYPD